MQINQSTLLKISLTISLLGILLLLSLSNILEPKLIDIGEINDKMLNKKVKIQATISKIEDKTDFLILSVSDSTGKIDVLCNCNNQVKLNQEVIVIGRITEYKQTLQVSADKILRK